MPNDEQPTTAPPGSPATTGSESVNGRTMLGRAYARVAELEQQIVELKAGEMDWDETIKFLMASAERRLLAAKLLIQERQSASSDAHKTDTPVGGHKGLTGDSLPDSLAPNDQAQRLAANNQDV